MHQPSETLVTPPVRTLKTANPPVQHPSVFASMTQTTTVARRRGARRAQGCGGKSRVQLPAPPGPTQPGSCARSRGLHRPQQVGADGARPRQAEGLAPLRQPAGGLALVEASRGLCLPGPFRSAPPRPAPTSKMVALQSGRGLRPLVSGRCGLDGRVEVRAPLWVSPLTVPTDAVLEPGSAVHLARPAYLRGLLQGERSMGNSRPGGLAPGVGDMTWGSPLVSGRGKSWPRFFSEPGGPSPSGQGEQASDLRGSACASLHRPPQGLAVTAHR